jgi:membrane associated rhomboid family serine protease
MALEDRDYMNRPLPRSAFGRPAVRSVTFWIIVLNVAVFLIDRVLWWLGVAEQQVFATSRGPVAFPPFPQLYAWGYFSAALAVWNWEIWRFVTFQFIHASAEHLIFNMIALYVFGPLIEAYLTARLFLPFYLMCGIGGAGTYLLLLLMGWRVGNAFVPLVGASAGIFGILVAAARIAPDSTWEILGVIPIRMRTLAYYFILYALFTVLFRGANAGGEAAHLGGAAVGYLLLEWPEALERLGWVGRRAPPF